MEQRETLEMGTRRDETSSESLRRRRRRAAVAVCAAAALAVAGYAMATRPGPPVGQPVHQHVHQPVDRHLDQPVHPADERWQVRGEAIWWPGGASRPQLRAGTYELPLDRHGFPFTALVTLPEGWWGWYGPDRAVGRHGYVGLLLVSVMQVVSRPCHDGTRGMELVGDGAPALVEALTRMPAHRVTLAPRPDHRFGLPGTYLQVRGTRAVRCPGGAEFELWNTTGGLVPAVGPHALMDLWVVDLRGTPVLVAARSAQATPAWALRQLDRVVASVDLDPRHGLGIPPWVAPGGDPAGRARPAG